VIFEKILINVSLGSNYVVYKTILTSQGVLENILLRTHFDFNLKSSIYIS